MTWLFGLFLRPKDIYKNAKTAFFTSQQNNNNLRLVTHTSSLNMAD